MQISVTRRDETPREVYQRRRAAAAAGLSFALFSGPVTWLIHALILWALVEMGCFGGLHTMRIASTNLIDVLIIGSTIVAALVMVAGFFNALRCIRRVHHPEGGCTDGRTRLLATFGAAFNPLFMTAVLLEISLLLLSPTCGAAGF